MTTYVVLEKTSDGGFRYLTTVESTTDRGAINKALDGVTTVEDEYAAVPARSWRPRKVSSEVKTQLKIS